MFKHIYYKKSVLHINACTNYSSVTLSLSFTLVGKMSRKCNKLMNAANMACEYSYFHWVLVWRSFLIKLDSGNQKHWLVVVKGSVSHTWLWPIASLTVWTRCVKRCPFTTTHSLCFVLKKILEDYHSIPILSYHTYIA